MNARPSSTSEAEFLFAERLATLLDNQFRFGRWGFGLDAIIDLLPVGGDVIVLGLSLVLVVIGLRMGLPRSSIVRMLVNISAAFVIGLVPIVGDLAYLLVRPNMRNLEILRAHR